MATFSKLQSLIKALHGDKAATIAALSEGFREDFGHFVKANNSEAIAIAAGELKKTVKDKAILEAISEGRKACGLIEGYIGARLGSLSKQPQEVQDKFSEALDRAATAFTASLEACEAFADKVPKTDAEKAKAKEDKATKAKEDKEALIVAMVQSGEIVRACDVRKIEDFSQVALIEALMVQGFDVEAMKAEYETLKAEYETLKAEYETLKASKKTKTRAAV